MPDAILGELALRNVDPDLKPLPRDPNSPPVYAPRLGVDVGQSVDPTAMSAVEVVHDKEHGSRFFVRKVGRLGLNTPYPVIAKTIVGAARNLRERTQLTPDVVIDATGVGKPVVDLVTGPLAGIARVVPVIIQTGDAVREQDQGYGAPAAALHGAEQSYRRRLVVGKTFMVSRLKALLQTGRLVGEPTDPEFKAAQEQLVAYQMKAKGNHDTYSAPSGQHDDLVIALALASLEEPGSDVTSLSASQLLIRGPRIMGWDAW